MRYLLVALWMLCGSVTSAIAQVSVGIGIGLPGVSIGINLPLYPELVRVPGYPVYYAPQVNSNFFFYDGMYWVYERDEWYASTWYNGPWSLVDPQVVPLFVLRIPVRYYRSPPAYFRGWRAEAPPRWGEHWGNDWERHRRGWNQWNHRSAPSPAPLPAYQRQYSGDRYPQQIERQQSLRSQNYRHQPRDPVVRQHEQQQQPNTPAPVRHGQTAAAPEIVGTRPHIEFASPPAGTDRNVERQERGPRAAEPRGPASPPQLQRPRQDPGQREQRIPAQDQRDMSFREGRPKHETSQGPGQGTERGRTEERGR